MPLLSFAAFASLPGVSGDHLAKHLVSIIELVRNYFNEDRLRRDESLKVTPRFMGINYYFIRAVFEWPELKENPTYPVREDINK